MVGRCCHTGQFAHPSEQHVDGRAIQATFGNDHIGMNSAGFDEVFMRGPNGRHVLVHHAVGRAATFDDVAPQSADEAQIGGSVNKDLKVESFAQFARPQHQDAFDDDDRTGPHPVDVVGAVVDGVVVHRHGRGASGEQFVEVGAEEIPVECIGVVIVDRGPFLHGLAGATQVIGIESDQAEMVRSNDVGQSLSDRRLARTRAPGDADDEGPVVHREDFRRAVTRHDSGGACIGYRKPVKVCG